MKQLKSEAERQEALRAKREQEAAEFIKQFKRINGEVSTSDPDAYRAVCKLGSQLKAEWEKSYGMGLSSHSTDLLVFAWNDPASFRKTFMEGKMGRYLLNKPDPEAEKGGIVVVRRPRLGPDLYDPQWLKLKALAQELYANQVKGFAEKWKANGYQRLVLGDRR
jgi:hypothetical protein